MTNETPMRERIARIMDKTAFDPPDGHWQHFETRRKDAFEIADAVLDAAVTSQSQSGVRDVTDYMSGMADGYEKGRADALEEAALLVKASVRGYFGENIAAAIRALKDVKP